MNSKILQGVLDHPLIKYMEGSENLAEVTSLCSDTSFEIRQLWHRSLNNPMNCLAMFVILPLIPGITRNEFWKEKLVAHMAQQCYQYNYQGDWTIVQEILEQRNQSLNGVLRTLLKYKDTYYLFGNLLPLCLRLVPGLQARKAYQSVEFDLRPVSYPKVKRGYNDKGTLPDSQKLSMQHYRRINLEPRVDRREHIRYTRSHEWFGKKRKSN